MDNRDTVATRRYHDGTKHSLRSVRESQHSLDWDNQPIPYKIYSSLPAIPLPSDFPSSPARALDVIADGIAPADGERIPDLAALARLCLYSNGVVRRIRRSWGEQAFRAAACTGALFHIELYLVCGDLEGLESGVYHYTAHDHGLRRLRAGDFRQSLALASGSEASVVHAPVIAVCTSTFWRNAWKYQARAYRHSFWDGGTVLANLLAEAAAIGVPARIVLGFVDASVNDLLGVDGEREAAIALVSLGRSSPARAGTGPLDTLDLPTVPLSRREVDYPSIRLMHGASCLGSVEDVREWRAHPAAHAPPSTSGTLAPLRPLSSVDRPAEAIESVIRRRGSTRRFARLPTSFELVSAMLEQSTRVIPADCFDPARPLNDLYLIANAVEGLESGTYVMRREERALEVLKRGAFRNEAGYLDLGQELAADAALNIYLLADLGATLERYGNRGYRAAQLEAAIIAGKLYLAAYALGQGATGLTFFDDEVVGFFSPHAAGKSVMFLIAIGVPDRQRKT